jgi:peptidoglycan hydrolase-like protein with peptidoglycan-binding domain
VKIGRVVVAVVAAAAVVGAASAAALGFGGSDEGTSNGGAKPPATATVTRTTLYDRKEVDGTLGHGSETAVAGRINGTVTWLPETGTLVQRGQTLYRVDNTPVVLMHGTMPAYRELRSGVEGADVKQFESELRALGYTGFTVDDEFTSSTAAAVREWQEDLGLEETGTVELGRVVFASGVVRVAGVEGTVGGSAQGNLLNISGTTRVVTVTLEVADQRLAVKGAQVTVELPGGKTATGTISAVATVITPAQGETEASTDVEVTVTLAEADQKSIEGFDRATVDVTFTVSERKNVLAVPVAALLALAEGGYGVEVVEADGTTRIMRVETGLFSGGRVEITGEGLAEGMTVGVPS